MVVLSLALVAAGSAVLVFGTTRQERPVEATAVTGSTATAPPGDQNAGALAAVQTEVKGVAAALGGPPGSESAKDEGRPAFDVARIEPSGDAVIAGRAAPGASVELLRNGKLHDRVVADKSGQFAMVPPRLPPGDYELTLRSSLTDGRQAISKDSVVVALQPDLKDRPVVALMRPDKPSVVLSKPATPNATSGTVAVEMVETEPGGKLYVSGRSPPGAAVRLYLNDSYLASTTAARDGRFAFTVDGGVSPGGYRVRLDEVEPGSGAIRSRAEVPFRMPETVAANDSGSNRTVGSSQSSPSPGSLQTARTQDAAGPAGQQKVAAATASDADSPAAVTVPKVATTVVSRGDSLWRISRAAYGTGARYSIIYDANHNQIQNPNRIYPGQIFVLPEKTR
jgi:nucleoid-associated protein YgaU